MKNDGSISNRLWWRNAYSAGEIGERRGRRIELANPLPDLRPVARRGRGGDLSRRRRRTQVHRRLVFGVPLAALLRHRADAPARVRGGSSRTPGPRLASWFSKGI